MVQERKVDYGTASEDKFASSFYTARRYVNSISRARVADVS